MEWSYISGFDGVTIVDSSTTKHLSLIGDTAEIIDRFQTLANGTVINYDGTADADTTPGRASQFVVASANSTAPIAGLNSLLAKKGNRGTITASAVNGTATYTCTGILTDITMIQAVPKKNYYRYGLHFNLETDWG